MAEEEAQDHAVKGLAASLLLLSSWQDPPTPSSSVITGGCWGNQMRIQSRTLAGRYEVNTGSRVGKEGNLSLL